VRYESARKESRLLHFADGGAMVERVISHRFDGIEDGQAAAGEHLQVHAEASIDHFCKRLAFGEECTGAGDEILHQENVTLIEAPFNNVVLGESVRRSGIERDVNASDVQVARNILPEVRELQRRTGGVGKALALLVTVPAQIQH